MRREDLGDATNPTIKIKIPLVAISVYSDIYTKACFLTAMWNLKAPVTGRQDRTTVIKPTSAWRVDPVTELV